MDAEHPFAEGSGPTWACGWGQDRYGPWAELAVRDRERQEDVVQRFRWIPPGRFWMGSPNDEAGRSSAEGPIHPVTLTRGFWLGDTPVTQALWDAVLGRTEARESARLPVTGVSWSDATSFAQRLAERLGDEQTWRLPTEAEWEYACRGGTMQPPWAGASGAQVLAEVAWFDANSEGKGREVALKAANPLGLYDMLGNVWEWVVDAYTDYAEGPLTDPVERGGLASSRVFRGGSWSAPAQFCRAACRYRDHPSHRWRFRGFRLARGP